MFNKIRKLIGLDKEIPINLTGIVESLQKNSIRVVYDTTIGQNCTVGSSKIGGKPDLPSDFKWFYFNGKAYTDNDGVYIGEGVVKNRPLSFLAQINCEEASKFDTEKALPSKGMLYFFYELGSMTWGFDQKDKGSARVYYHSGEMSELHRTDFPSDLPNEYPKQYHLPEMAISFSSVTETPDLEEFEELYDGLNKIKHKERKKLWSDYNVARGLDSIEGKPEGQINKLLGYADLVQGGMLLNCELVTNGINTGDLGWYANISAEQAENSKNWRLLFQLDSIYTDYYEMMWGDMGRIYFYIKDEDLRNLKFEDCWLVLQCG